MERAKASGDGLGSQSVIAQELADKPANADVVTGLRLRAAVADQTPEPCESPAAQSAQLRRLHAVSLAYCSRGRLVIGTHAGFAG